MESKSDTPGDKVVEIDRPDDLILILLDHATTEYVAVAELEEADNHLNGLYRSDLKEMMEDIDTDPFPFEDPLNDYAEFMETIEMFDAIGFIPSVRERSRMGLSEKARAKASELRDALDGDQEAAVRAVIEAHPEEFDE